MPKEKKVKEMKPVKAWAVVNRDLNCLCLTGYYTPEEHKYVGSAIFESRRDAREYAKTFPENNFIKVLQVKITPIKRKAGR